MQFSDTARLIALEEIKRLKARYCRYLDTKQWQALASLFTADVRFDGFASAPSGSDGATFVLAVSTRLGPAFTMHHCHTPDIEFLGPDQARGVWSMADYLEWPEPMGLAEAPLARGVQGFGHYEEEYRRVGDVWRIAHLRLRRTRLVPLPSDHPPQTSPTWAAGLGWLPSESQGA